MPRGRPKLPDTPTNAERQRRVRMARAAKVGRWEELEAAAKALIHCVDDEFEVCWNRLKFWTEKAP